MLSLMWRIAKNYAWYLSVSATSITWFLYFHINQDSNKYNNAFIYVFSYFYEDYDEYPGRENYPDLYPPDCYG